jgi:RNA polymerase sigma factor (sigma-70 family)
MKSILEKELIEGCIDNDCRYQKELYRRYCNAMMGVCIRYAPTVQDAEDLLQDSFIKVFKKIHTFQAKGSLGGWVKKVVVNTCLQFFRDNKNLSMYVELKESDFTEEVSFDVLNQMNVDDLKRKIQSLPDGFRIVFNMFAIEGFSHKEIAEELKISIGTSKSQLSRAKTHLQKLINQEKNKENISVEAV